MKQNKTIISMNRPNILNRNILRNTILTLVGLLIVFSVQAAENHALNGQVTDAATHSGINAAKITVLNQTNAATSAEDGTFTLKVSSKTAILKVSAFGYATRYIAVRGKSVLNIKLYPETFSQPAPIEHTATYLKTGDQPTSIAVSSDELVHDVFTGNLRSALRSGATGVGSSLFIRGLNSLNINSQPLFVVDGIIRDNLYDAGSIHAGFFNNPLTNIATGDIASIQILKDGTGIYGSKGSNGVILIETKRGTDMVTKIDLNIYSGFTGLPKTYPVLGSSDYRIYLTEILGTAGLTNQEILQLPFLNDDPARYSYKRYHNNTDWSNSVYQAGYNSNYEISVNGGDEKALYYFSLGYTSDKGVVKKNDFQRYNMRLNADINLSDKIKTGINVGFTRSDRNLLDDGEQEFTSPSWMSNIKAPILSPNTFTYTGEQTSEIDFYDIFNIGNPVGIIEKSINTVKQNGFNFGLRPEYKINQTYTLKGVFDYNLNKISEDYYRPYLYAAPIFIPGIGYSENARMSQVLRNTTFTGEIQLNYFKKLAANTLLKAEAGSRIMQNAFVSDYVEGHNSRSNSAINLKGSFDNLVTDGINNITNTVSNYLHFDLSHNSRYMLDASVTMDASSRFGNETIGGVKIFGQDWGIFPSVQAAWIVTGEEFMKDIELLDMLKIRAGYTITGNDQIPLYQNRTYFNAVKLEGVASGLVLSTLRNPQIQWETTYRKGIGFDASMLADKISLSVDVYSSATQNLLVMKNLPDFTGLSYYWKNEGSLSNKGIEATLNVKMANTRQFQWELAASIGHYQNNIESLPNGSFVTKVLEGEILSTEGQAAGVFYGYKTLGVFSTEADAIAADLKMKNAQGVLVNFGAGDMIFEDLADAQGVKDKIINENDRQIIGDPNPDFYGSVNSKMTFGDLTLSALFTWSYGNDIYNYARQMLESSNGYQNQSRSVLARWTAEGQVTNVPKAVFGDPMGNARFSDRWIEDGSYLKLKNITVSYKLPVKVLFLEAVNVWASASNLFTLTNYLGMDPEVSAGNAVLLQGIDAGYIPSVANYTLGVKINL